MVLIEQFQIEIDSLDNTEMCSHCFSQERGVEAIHARATQSLSGGRPLSAQGLSVELKWQTIEELLQASPQAWPWPLSNGFVRLHAYLVSIRDRETGIFRFCCNGCCPWAQGPWPFNCVFWVLSCWAALGLVGGRS